MLAAVLLMYSQECTDQYSWYSGGEGSPVSSPSSTFTHFLTFPVRRPPHDRQQVLTIQDGQTQRGHDRGPHQGQRPQPGQEAQLLGRRALRHLRHQEAEECRGSVTQVIDV